MPLAEGWNMLGPVMMDATFAGPSVPFWLDTSGRSYRYVAYGWNPAAGAYSPLTDLTAGVAFWIRSDMDTWLDLGLDPQGEAIGP
jgi:hypothetical protein